MPHKDPEKRKAYGQAWRDAHKSDTRDYNKQYRQDNKEQLALDAKRRVMEHAEDTAEYQVNYRASHKDETKAYNHQHYEDHKEQRKANQRQYQQEHKLERGAYNEQWNKDNRPKSLKYHREYNPIHQLELKTRVLTHYGNGKAACVRCGFDADIQGLTIDHIDGGGNQQRKAIPSHFYDHLEREHYPTGFQTLCGVCQAVKREERNENAGQKANLTPAQQKAKNARRKAYKARRLKIITHYTQGTMACAKCGTTEYAALSIDHIKGNGNEHRKAEHISSGDMFYRWLLKNDYPKDYQCICMRCQLIKRSQNHELRKPKGENDNGASN